MVYRILADVVLVLHFGFVMWVVLGWLLVRRWRWLMWLHLPAAAWGVIIEFAGWPCPLTPLEQRLRELGGEAGFEGGFIEHYVGLLLYPGWLDETVQIVLGVVVLLLNVGGYWWVFSRPRRTASGRGQTGTRSDEHQGDRGA